jgi:glycyl-tRNA synthetase beta chain
VERVRFVLEARGADRRNVRAVTSGSVLALQPATAAAQVEALGLFASSAEFTQLATAFKRVKNIAEELKGIPPLDLGALSGVLHEPAEQTLLDELQRRLPSVAESATQQNFTAALARLSELGPPVDRFFTDVLVMTDDATMRTARLSLMAHLRDAVLRIGDVSEVVAVDK